MPSISDWDQFTDAHKGEGRIGGASQEKLVYKSGK